MHERVVKKRHYSSVDSDNQPTTARNRDMPLQVQESVRKEITMSDLQPILCKIQ